MARANSSAKRQTLLPRATPIRFVFSLTWRLEPFAHSKRATQIHHVQMDRGLLEVNKRGRRQPLHDGVVHVAPGQATRIAGPWSRQATQKQPRRSARRASQRRPRRQIQVCATAACGPFAWPGASASGSLRVIIGGGPKPRTSDTTECSVTPRTNWSNRQSFGKTGSHKRVAALARSRGIELRCQHVDAHTFHCRCSAHASSHTWRG